MFRLRLRFLLAGILLLRGGGLFAVGEHSTPIRPMASSEFGSFQRSPYHAAWGINLDANSDWSTLGAWVDAAHTLRRWGDFKKPWQEKKFSLLPTADGTPREDAAALSYLGGYTEGIYQLRYRGTGTVSVHGLGAVIADTVRRAAGVTTADVRVEVPNGRDLLIVRLADVSPDDPVRDLSLIAPGYAVDTRQVFRSEFKRRLEPFRTIRFMDWAVTNNSRATSWAKRRQPTSTIQTFAYGPPEMGGVAWEHMIQLANETHKNAWINVPHLADRDYVRNLARVWRDRLDPKLTLTVEYSNEPWNHLFTQARDGQSDYYRVVAPRLLRISEIFHRVFAGETDRLEIVLCGQCANAWHTRSALRYFTDQGHDPRGVVGAVGIAPYFEIDSRKHYEDVDSMFADLRQQTEGIHAHRETATEYGLRLYAYEAGQHFVPGPTSERLIREAQSDPRMGAAYREFAQLWHSVRGDLVLWYSLARNGGRSGFWGLLEDVRQHDSVKWTAVTELANGSE